MDWELLTAEAVAVAERAYAPYSGFPVGAAAKVVDGRVVVGCNVENAAYGVVLCAECGVVSQLYATGGGRLTHFVCVNGLGEVIMPCGRCRQLLFEHGGNELVELFRISAVDGAILGECRGELRELHRGVGAIFGGGQWNDERCTMQLPILCAR